MGLNLPSVMLPLGRRNLVCTLFDFRRVPKIKHSPPRCRAYTHFESTLSFSLSLSHLEESTLFPLTIRQWRDNLYFQLATLVEGGRVPKWRLWVDLSQHFEHLKLYVVKDESLSVDECPSFEGPYPTTNRGSEASWTRFCCTTRIMLSFCTNFA
jgi:hypothetical protein